MRLFASALIAVCGLAASANADVLAEFTFEGSVPTTAGPHAAEGGVFAATAQARGFHASGATAYSNPVGNGSGESFSSNNWAAGDYYEFSTSTLGYEDITFVWDQTRSNTGPATFDVLFSVNGGAFQTIVDDYTVDPLTWSSGTYNPGSTFAALTLPVVADDAALVTVRLVSQVTAASGGTNRVDNIVFSGTLVPAPGALALAGLGGLVATRRRRA